jgi:NAD-dependent dihydropyrimidine dehydrogenase PreA subunit
MPQKEPLFFLVDWNACIKCGACIAVCPQEAGFTSPFDTIAVEQPCGIVCMDCEKICPVTAISHRAALASELALTVGPASNS